MVRKFIPIPISELNNDTTKYCCKYVYKRGVNIGKKCLSGIYKNGVCKKHYCYIEKSKSKNYLKKCIYNTASGTCNRKCNFDSNYCKYHKNNDKHKVTIKCIYDKKKNGKNNSKKYLDIDGFIDIKNLVIKDYSLTKDSINSTQVILYEPNIFLDGLNNIFKHKINKKKIKKQKYKERKKIKLIEQKNCAINSESNEELTFIKKEFIYTGICPLGIKTFEYIKSPFKKSITINNIEFKCLRWKLNRFKIEVIMVIECLETSKKYKHTIKENDFKELMFKEYPKNIVENYLYN